MLKRTELNMKQAIILLLALGAVAVHAETIRACGKYQRIDQTWSKSYKVTGTIQDGFFVIQWRKGEPTKVVLGSRKSTLKIQEIVHGFSRPDGRTAIKPSSWHLILIEY